jgi:hypothetical protein
MIDREGILSKKKKRKRKRKKAMRIVCTVLSDLNLHTIKSNCGVGQASDRIQVQ